MEEELIELLKISKLAEEKSTKIKVELCSKMIYSKAIKIREIEKDFSDIIDKLEKILKENS